MPTKTEFVEQLADAYEHLYDLVYLRTHPLIEQLTPASVTDPKDRAWQLHHILMDAIEELNPGPQAPTYSREWRRHRLMVLRFEDGLEAQMTARELSISRRHFYRERDAAIEAIANVLWNRYTAQLAEAPPQPEPSDSMDRQELLRLETMRVARDNRYARLGSVVEKALLLLNEMLRQRNIEVQTTFPEIRPGISMGQDLLRQMLLGMMGYLIEQAEDATLLLAAQAEEMWVHFSMKIEPPAAIQPKTQAEIAERLSAFEELAALSETRVTPICVEEAVAGFELQLPIAERTVLVVDDNEDILQLFQRYLDAHHYDIATTQTPQQAVDLARRIQPHAIILDLMMPEQDGWDILQTLRNQPETVHIPIIVCSILKQKDLALSLGATAFLQKPVSEQELLLVLETLEAT